MTTPPRYTPEQIASQAEACEQLREYPTIAAMLRQAARDAETLKAARQEMQLALRTTPPSQLPIVRPMLSRVLALLKAEGSE